MCLVKYEIADEHAQYTQCALLRRKSKLHLKEETVMYTAGADVFF